MAVQTIGLKIMGTNSDKVNIVHSSSRWLHSATLILVIAIAAGAGVLSFDGLTSLASASGIRPELAWVWALVVDGFILVATFATYVLKDRVAEDRFKKYYAWFVLGLFVTISIFGNAWHAVIIQESIVLPDWVKICVSAIPPVAFFLAGHLLIIMMTPTEEEKKEHKRDIAREERKQRMKDKELISEEKILDTNLKRKEESVASELVTKVEETKISTSVPAVKAPVVKEPMIYPPESQSLNVLTSSTEESFTDLTPSDSVAVNISLVPNVNHEEVVDVVAEGAVEEVNEIKVSPIVNNVSRILSKEAAIARILEMLENGESMPSGKEVGEWVGRKERSGQNIIKEARSSFLPNQ